jgi:predicted N-acyltransferase
MKPEPATSQYVVEVHQSLSAIPAQDWDACANPPGQPHNPFVRHAFLSALEQSGSATADTGWLGQHLQLRDANGATLAVMPCYLKNHSQGEYVFDYGWADAIHRAGGRYYPKLQVSIPFTPASGPRVLTAARENSSAVRAAMGNAAQQLCDKLGASSVHMTFLKQDEYDDFGAQGWLQRNDTQFHWHNDGFSSFDQFLGALSSRKRKNIRKERKAVHEAGLEILPLTGSDITEEHWDHFFRFYIDTGGRKWGSPYLTRDFFSLVGETMAEDILLVMVRNQGRWIAGAINFIGGDTLYGRNWGCVEYHDCLHFEACYYQAIDFAIGRGLKTVEAGAQGPHKLARGYLPVTTRSVHHIRDPRLHAAVADYLEHERPAVAQDNRYLGEHSPFRKAAERDMAGDF